MSEKHQQTKRIGHMSFENKQPLEIFWSDLQNYALFRKKRFEINFFVRQNASKFAIFIEKENPRSFFRFSFRAFLSFTL